MKLPILAAILTCVGMGAANGARVALVLQTLRLESGPVVVGTLLATFSIIAALFSIPMGRVVDRLGIRGPLALSLATICVGALLVAAIPALGASYVAAVLIGTGAIGITISLTSAVGAEGDSALRMRGFAIYTIGVSGSNALGPMIAGFAIDGFGFQAGFALLALLSLIALLLLSVFRKSFARPSPSKETPSKRPFELLWNRKLFPIYLAATLNAMMWDGYQFLAPVWGTHVGLSASAIGVVIGSFSLATLFIRIVMPLIASRFKEWTLISATVFLGGLGFALFPFTSGLWTMVFVSCVLGAGFGFGYPMILAISFAMSPMGREAEVTGIRSALSSTVRFLVPLALGGLSTVMGVGALAWGVAALMFSGSLHARLQLRSK